jgi:3-phosphoshikimate 1-carboxyvinyltransferase
MGVMRVVVHPATRLRGTLRMPGDKSISHRYALLAGLASGQSIIHNYAPGADCASTLACLAALGVTVTREPSTDSSMPDTVVIAGRGLGGLRAPSEALDCGNSGSTMRMLAGVLSGHLFQSTLMGDASLSRRPMRRIIGPLGRMGARIDAHNDRPPLVVHGADLAGIDFVPDVPSAQVKSAVLLAGLQARGRTRVTERISTRDHTERALAAFGIPPVRDGNSVEVSGGSELRGQTLRVAGDVSSAAFPCVAAAALAGSEVTIADVGLNPTRTAVLDVLRRFGAQLETRPRDDWQGEPVGEIRVQHAALRALELGGDEVPGLIDELPVLAALATFGGELRVTGASELRVKESDRITALVAGLRAIGADAEELPDGFHVRARGRLHGGTVTAHGDHRLAMAFAIAALGASAPVIIEGADAVAVSYPAFFQDLDRLRV